MATINQIADDIKEVHNLKVQIGLVIGGGNFLRGVAQAAKGTDRATSDIDLMVLSDSLSYSEAFGSLQTVEAELGRPVNPTVMRSATWRAKRAKKDSFVSRIATQPRIFVLGSDHDLD